MKLRLSFARLVLAVAASFIAAVAASAVSVAPPRPVIASANANLRAKPSLNAEVLLSVKKGQQLLRLGDAADPKAQADEPKDWIEVAAPEGTKVWIYGALVDTSTKAVRVNKAFLRAGPGRNYANVGFLTKGQKVQELRSADGWVQIAAPEGAVVAYVAKNLLKDAPTEAAALPAPSNRPPAVVRQPAPSRPTPPLPATASRPQPTVARTLPPEPAVTGQPLNPPTPAAQPTPVVPQPLPEPVITPQPTPQTEAPRPEPAPSQPAVTTTATPELPAQPEIVHTDKTRRVLREGVVAPARSPQAPGDYQLNNFRKGEGPVGFLYVEDESIKLESWLWRRVLVTGEEYLDERWSKIPLIKVISLQPAY